MSSSNDADNCEIGANDHAGDRVDEPNPNDVLCGRGGNINSHKGNEQFRKLVEKRKRVYLTARFKREKRLIASSIVNEIRAMDPPGRFLARKGSMKDDSGFWYDIGDEKARDKTSQALRENAPSIRAEIETEINQQRAEMRRQEATTDPQPSSAKSGPNESSYPSAPIGHHHPGSHGHLGNPPPPIPPPPHPGHSHTYSPAHQSHYSQQYYDYYYHYYGYGAPPPPPPPGYTSNAAAPAGAPPHPSLQPGYPPATQPHPYWAAQSSPNAAASGNRSTPPGPPATSAVVTPSPHSPSGRSTGVALNPSAADAKSPPMAEGHASSAVDSTFSPFARATTQEEEDRRLAMALQQEENAKAFEDRNRRFGSDRRSSRSTAYCAPGYRPRLLNDSVEAPNEGGFGTPNRKKRPPMSASHFFGPSHSFSRERANTGSSAPSNGNMENDSNLRMEEKDHYEMNLKPPAQMHPKREGRKNDNNADNSHGIDQNHNHDHDFSCSSFSTRGRMEFKDDSEFSMFGEGGTIVPSSNANSTGSFSRVRNVFSSAFSNKDNKHSNAGSNSFNPISLDQSDRNHGQSQQYQHKCDSSRGDDNRSHNRKHCDHHQHSQEQQDQQNHQESSLLSQVASHILGNFGGSSWTDSNNPSNKRDHQHHHGGNDEPEMEMELGQEVIMDVRDESSSMPPPQSRGNGTQVDWPSRAGCHTWIPDSMVDTTASCNFGHDDNNRDMHTTHQHVSATHHSRHRHHHPNDHSLNRETSYGRADISPINSMDMDFSLSSSLGGHRQRTNNINGGASTLMNVFEKKTADLNPEELLPQIHRSGLQQTPSWERSYRSRSPVSLGELSGVDEMDGSLIRVHSRDAKDKLFGMNGSTVEPQPSTSIGQYNVHQQPHHQNHQHGSHHHPPQGQQYQSPMKPSAMHGHHNQAPLSSRAQNYSESREIDMDWD